MLHTPIKHGSRKSPVIAIIGAGVAGILLGLKLRERGLKSFTIYEKAGDLGGTWRDNTYPGLSCDVPAHLYVYSFAPNPDWSRRFARGPEIYKYYRGIAEKYGVVPHIRYNKELVSAFWQDGRWRLVFGDGDEAVADIVIGAVGRLHHPNYPDIPDLDRFAGPTFHSARWDHSVDLKGRRLGLIGTGSSSTQIVSALADKVSVLKLFQRTPQWVMPWPDPPYTPLQKAIFRYVPFAARAHYKKLRSEMSRVGEAILHPGELRSRMAHHCERGLEQVRDPELRAKLTPDYTPGCKRIVISPKFHEAVQKPSVDVVTSPIAGVEAGGIRTADGTLHEIDALVLATGFKAHAFLRPIKLEGENGVTLDEMWADDPLTYRAVALPHMPNFFTINGAYSTSGSTSIVGLIEIHVAYVLKLIDRVVERGRPLSPCPRKSKEWVEKTRAIAATSLWATGGCKSYYLDRHGIPLINPMSIDELEADMRQPDFDDFVEHAGAPERVS